MPSWGGRDGHQAAVVSEWNAASGQYSPGCSISSAAEFSSTMREVLSSIPPLVWTCILNAIMI